MLHIERVQDIEVLRQIALLQEREIEKLHDRLTTLSVQLARLTGQDASKAQIEIDILKDLLAQRERALFGDSSEKRPPEGDRPVAPKKPRKGHGPTEQTTLPIVEEIHDLPASEQACPECGGSLAEMKGQFEESEEITVVQREFKLVKHLRKKYRCACNACVVTAPGPLKLQAGGRYSIEFAVEVAAAKYLDHLPLERQVRMMTREGLVVSSQTLWDQIDILARHLEPTYEALGRQILRSPFLHADETPWRLMGKGKSLRWWVWSINNKDAVFYRIQASRSAEAAGAILKDYQGIAMVDGYSAYKSLASQREGPFRLVHCWAHVRRKFREAEHAFPRECRVALDLIRDLYLVEREAPRGQDQASLGIRAELRVQRSKPIVDAIKVWAEAQWALPESRLGKAITYMLKLWPGLTAFLEEPAIPLDNNAAERGIRGVVIGRKNHYGSRSQRGTEVAALFYSLFETAKLCGVEPKHYVLQAARQAIAEPDTSLLPILQTA